MAQLHAPASRWSASGLHAAISLVVIGTIAVAAVLWWFPAGLWHLSGVQRLFGIMIGADVVLGPLLTLLVYRRGKPGMRLDLWVIALAQAAFLAYGVHTLWLNRSLVLAGSQQAFALVFASELPDDAPARMAKVGWPRFHRHGPWLVGVDLSSPVAREEFLFAYLAGNSGPLRDPDLYIPYDRIANDVLGKARAPDKALSSQLPEPNGVRTIAAFSLRVGGGVMLLDARTGHPLRVVR
jgi:hypothetical protein